MRNLLESVVPDGVSSIASVLAVAVAVLAVTWIVRLVGSRTIARRDGSLSAIAFEHLKRPVSYSVVLAAVAAAHPLYQLDDPGARIFDRLIVLLLVVVITWIVVKVLYVAEAFILAQYDIDASDNLRARKVQTQVGFLKRTGIVAAIVLGISAALLTFDAVREIGATLLASAGVAGIIVGLAAQRTLGHMLSGLQVAFTQPIRLDDVLIVEGEWGRVEEIGLTYVVLRIWDQRRLVVPVSYFLETPFQNWTRVTSELLGTVFLRVDYSCPLEPLRRELKRICETNEKWDGRVAIIQVFEVHERSVELRALVSAGDAPQLWDLRCAVREGLLEFLQREYPESLPRVRAELTGDASSRGERS